ncbi:MAG TPA: GNAT family protein [Alphaproteobacteria bacterium]|nr:GNAT family protein [Alphaproteobacteria bacterium]
METPLETGRLLLRRLRADDLDSFAAMNADAAVMRYFRSPLTHDESAAFMQRIDTHFDTHGFGFWAVEEISSGNLVGLTGLARVMFDAPFANDARALGAPCVEIGWRFVAGVWGRGYAPEAARAALAAGFGRFGLDEIVAFTVPDNAPSRRVMQKLGMTHSPADDFEHPNLPEGHALRPHVLYRLKAADFAD